MASTPDPVADAAEYQRFLLGFLGEDDPLHVQNHTPELLREIVGRAGDRIRIRPQHSQWSVLEVAGHILDCEVAATGRYRWTWPMMSPP